MAVPEAVIGPGEPVFPGQTDRPVDGAEAHEAPQPCRRSHRQEPLAAEVGGTAHDEPRHDMVAAARRVDGAGGVPRALHGDVTAGVAPADDEDALPRDRHRIDRRLVLAGMEERPVKPSRDVGPARRVVVAIGDHEASAHDRSAAGGDCPAAAGAGHDSINRRARADVGPEREVVGVGAKVAEAASVVGVGWPLPRHRKVGEGGERFRADQPRRREDRRSARAEVPVATDVVLSFEADGTDPKRQEILEGRETGRPRADHTPPIVDAWRATHSRLPDRARVRRSRSSSV